MRFFSRSDREEKMRWSRQCFLRSAAAVSLVSVENAGVRREGLAVGNKVDCGIECIVIWKII